LTRWRLNRPDPSLIPLIPLISFSFFSSLSHLSFYPSHTSVSFLRNMKRSYTQGLVMALTALIVLNIPAMVSAEYSTLAIGKNTFSLIPYRHIEMKGSTYSSTSSLTATHKTDHYFVPAFNFIFLFLFSCRGWTAQHSHECYH